MTAAQKANRERFKKVMAEAKKLRAKNKKLTQAQAVKQAWAIEYSTKKKSAKPKKAAAKKKVAGIKKPVETKHTDTKSHNVNIRVMSGIAAIRGGSKFMLYKGMTIEKKPVTIGKKKSYVYIAGGMAWNTLADAKRYILHLSR